VVAVHGGGGGGGGEMWWGWLRKTQKVLAKLHPPLPPFPHPFLSVWCVWNTHDALFKKVLSGSFSPFL